MLLQKTVLRFCHMSSVYIWIIFGYGVVRFSTIFLVMQLLRYGRMVQITCLCAYKVHTHTVNKNFKGPSNQQNPWHLPGRFRRSLVYNYLLVIGAMRLQERPELIDVGNYPNLWSWFQHKVPFGIPVYPRGTRIIHQVSIT